MRNEWKNVNEILLSRHCFEIPRHQREREQREDHGLAEVPPVEEAVRPGPDPERAGDDDDDDDYNYNDDDAGRHRTPEVLHQAAAPVLQLLLPRPEHRERVQENGLARQQGDDDYYYDDYDYDDNDDDNNKAHSWEYSDYGIEPTLASSSFNAYIDILLSGIVFLLVSIACYVNFGASLPWIVVCALAGVYYVLVISVSLKNFLIPGASRSVIRKLYYWCRRWYPTQVPFNSRNHMRFIQFKGFWSSANRSSHYFSLR